MPTIDLRNLTQPFYMSVGETADFASLVNSGVNFFSYLSTGGHQINLIGTGLFQPGGQVTEVRIDLGNNDPFTPDVVITGVSLPLAVLDFNVGQEANDLLWNAVLQGPTTNIASPTQLFFLFGDTRTWASGLLDASNDAFVTENVAFQSSYGDAQSVTGGTVIGGDDTISGAIHIANGDVGTVENGSLVGGDDTITMTTVFTRDSFTQIVGDAQTVRDGTVIGGDDVIDVSIGMRRANVVGESFQTEGASLVLGGNDLIRGGGVGDTLHGDVRTVRSEGVVYGGNDTIFGNAGDDEIYGDFRTVDVDAVAFGGNDDLYGGLGEDMILGGGGNDTLRGGADNDTLLGGNDADTLIGDSGEDRLEGGDGGDILIGGSFSDRLIGGLGDDTIDGGSNFDTVIYTGIYVPVSVNLEAGTATGGAGSDTLVRVEHVFGSASHDTIYGTNLHGNRLEGSNGDDTIYGLDGRDTILGGNNDDRLYGGDDVDRLLGGSGDDYIEGGAGTDFLTGGSGADNFVFREIGDTGVGRFFRDEIRDFNAAEGDVVNLFLIDANASAGGNQAFSFAGTSFTGSAGEIILNDYVLSGVAVTIASLDVDGDALADGQIYIVGGAGVGDFLL